MPTYDYVCDACDDKFELVQSMKDEPIKKCAKCGKKKLRRLFGIGAAVVFKGSGFYQTDYRSESYKKQAAAEKGGSSEGKSEAKGDGKSESKTETKSETKAETKAKEPASSSGKSGGNGAAKGSKAKSSD